MIHVQIASIARLVMPTIPFLMIMINSTKMEAHAFGDVMTKLLIGMMITGNVSLYVGHQPTMTKLLRPAKTVLKGALNVQIAKNAYHVMNHSILFNLMGAVWMFVTRIILCGIPIPHNVRSNC